MTHSHIFCCFVYNKLYDDVYPPQPTFYSNPLHRTLLNVLRQPKPFNIPGYFKKIRKQKYRIRKPMRLPWVLSRYWVDVYVWYTIIIPYVCAQYMSIFFSCSRMPNIILYMAQDSFTESGSGSCSKSYTSVSRSATVSVSISDSQSVSSRSPSQSVSSVSPTPETHTQPPQPAVHSHVETHVSHHPRVPLPCHDSLEVQSTLPLDTENTLVTTTTAVTATLQYQVWLI